jgi:hypothetical protein
MFYLYLSTSHLGVIRKGGQYFSTTVFVVSMRGSPLATASLERPYCLARNLAVSWMTVPRLPTSCSVNFPLT